MAFQLGVVGGYIICRSIEHESAAGLNDKQISTLAVLDLGLAGSQAELAEFVGVGPAAMVAIIAALEEAGLVERRRDPENRRKHLVALTDGGRARLQALEAAAGDIDAEIAAVTGQDTAAFRAGLAALFHQATALAPERVQRAVAGK
jgi:DNA-binding MarR family transcriptional regulator